MSKLIDLKLHCDLSESEVYARAQQMAEALREQARVQKQRADANKDFREQLEEIGGRLNAAAEAVREKSEYRLVACAVNFHSPVVGTKRTVRLDTGEFVRDEPMTDAERQLNLLEPEPSKMEQLNAALADIVAGKRRGRPPKSKPAEDSTNI